MACGTAGLLRSARRPGSSPGGTTGRAHDVSELAAATGPGRSPSGSTAVTLSPGSVRYGEDFAKTRQAMAFARPDLPVPAVLETGSALGGAYAISQRCFGVFLETLDEARWRRLLPALLRGLDTLRRTCQSPGPARAGGRSGASAARAAARRGWRDWLRSGLVDRPGERVSGWQAILARSGRAQRALRRRGTRVQRAAGACPEIRHVVHGDLLNRNVLVAAGRVPAHRGVRLGLLRLRRLSLRGRLVHLLGPLAPGAGRDRLPVRDPRPLPTPPASMFPGSASACAATSCTSASPTWPTARSPAATGRTTSARSPGAPARSPARAPAEPPGAGAQPPGAARPLVSPARAGTSGRRPGCRRRR